MCRLWRIAGVLLLCWVTVCRPEGNVGCLFSKTLCDTEYEWCYDDYAFGRCLPLYGSLGDDDLYRYDMDRTSLHALENEMQRLFALGYRWSHTYTQCVLQALLVSFRYDMTYDEELCNTLVDQDLEGALRAIEGDDQSVDPVDLAFVRFTPSSDEPHSDFADEVYFPTLLDDQKDAADEEQTGVRDPNYYPPSDDDNDVSVPGRNKKAALPPEAVHFSSDYNTPDRFRNGIEVKWRKRSNDFPAQDDDDDDEVMLTPEEMLELANYMYGIPDYGNRMPIEDEEEMEESERSVPEVEEENGAVFLGDIPGLLGRNPELLLNQEEYPDEKEDEDEDTSSKPMYTEGGLIVLPEEQREEQEKRAYAELLATLAKDQWGFKRRERLDVKKPGPFFQHSPNDEDDVDGDVRSYLRSLTDEDNEISNVQGPPMPDDYEQMPIADDMTHNDDVDTDSVAEENNTAWEVAPFPTSWAQWSKRYRHVPQKKELTSEGEKGTADTAQQRTPQPTGDTNRFDVVDTNYAYVAVRKPFKDYKEGKELVSLLSDLLHLPSGTLSNVRVESSQVTFKVEPIGMGLNASEVSGRIGTDDIHNTVKREMGVEIIGEGVGDKNKFPRVLELYSDSNRHLYTLTFVLCGLVAAFLIIAIALYVFRRHARSKEKVHSLTHPDTEASKDYQELCRARMASKSQEKPEPIHVGQRIVSLSRESEGSNNSPSSRSSTSSWSEEPVLTNMDISTGHMVLSYMEDHLKNKDRLEQEWVALCAYEAEPCASTIAQKVENVKKNRYSDIAPYDHARVVLNELANISGSDYINASTITDHDPRNPAYIATQGPVPQTGADFWQMIWEQGSVVIVMLTRLTENGVAMCHRYWPEEGSELYHIYEVHLVSEHIWCDDYLVRSFYLKNLKTGETRTVTQFHFLSWPNNGVPLSTKALLEFRRKVNKSYRGRSCPIVVHCSDGVGRSGTYCLIDMVLNRMAKGAKEIDIAATLEHIRDQRPGMVKSKQQFEFVLMAVAEEVHAILKALPQ